MRAASLWALSLIYLSWAYHGLGLGRRLMGETARRFRDRAIQSLSPHAEPSDPTHGLYGRMGGERPLNAQGRFDDACAWRDVSRSIPGAGLRRGGNA